MRSDPNTRLFIILTAVITLSIIGVAAIIGLQVVRSGNFADSTPLVTAILGFLAPTIVALLGLMRIEHNTEVTNKIQKDVQEIKANGHK